jgi:hypothetical protein
MMMAKHQKYRIMMSSMIIDGNSDATKPKHQCIMEGKSNTAQMTVITPQERHHLDKGE